VVASSNLITKVYFPRLVIPLASVGAGLVDLAIAGSVMAALMLYYGTPISVQILAAPLFVAGAVLTATGVGAFLAAMTVSYRDFRYGVPFLVQIWLFATPVIYPSAIIPPEFRWALALNPLTGLVEGFRACFLARPFDWPAISLAMAIAAAAFLGGSAFFQKVERRFADVI